jgi:hypothetical protein
VLFYPGSAVSAIAAMTVTALGGSRWSGAKVRPPEVLEPVILGNRSARTVICRFCDSGGR